MDLNEKIESINSKEDLADFLALLRGELNSDPDGWENRSLDGYLEAWIRSMEYAYKNMGREFPEQPNWKILLTYYLQLKFTNSPVQGPAFMGLCR